MLVLLYIMSGPPNSEYRMNDDYVLLREKSVTPVNGLF
jgi:hypothetical protein